MISPHFILPSLILPVLAGLLAAPALAEPPASPAQALTGQADRPALPAAPGRMRWDAPVGGLWVQGEASAGAPDPAPVTEPGLGHGAVALGARRDLALLPHLSLTLAPQIRLDAAGDPLGLPTARGLSGTMQQDLVLTLPGEAKLAGSFALMDHVGPVGAEAQPPVRTLRTRVSLALPRLSDAVPLKAEFQFAATRSLGVDREPDHLLSCELGLVLAWGAFAPLRLAGSCPGRPERRLTLGISGTF